MFNGHICSNIVIFSYLNDIARPSTGRTGGVLTSFISQIAILHKKVFDSLKLIDKSNDWN